MAMLDTIKNLVYQKQLFSEQARMVLDDDDNFDQLLLEDAEPTSSTLPEGTKDPLQNDNTQVQPEGEQPMPIDTATAPSTSDDEDIMNMNLDARTDTVSNVVPTPPPNAGDQIDTADSPNGGDIMDEEISDSEDDDSVELKKEPEEEPIESEKNMMDEEIPLNDEDEKEDDEEEEDTKDESGDVMGEEISEEEESTEMSEDEQLESAGIRIIGNESHDNFFNERIDLSDPYDLSDGNLFDESIDIYEESYDEEDIFNEAISLDGPDDSSGGGDLEPPKPEGDDKGDKDDSAPDSDLAPEGDNPVTAAVKDKVGESNDDSSIEPSEPGGDDDSSFEPTASTDKSELMKKVANITKSQIDLMAQIQNGQ